MKFKVTIYFEPDSLRDAAATHQLIVEADDEQQAIDKAERIQVLGYTAERADELDLDALSAKEVTP